MSTDRYQALECNQKAVGELIKTSFLLLDISLGNLDRGEMAGYRNQDLEDKSP